MKKLNCVILVVFLLNVSIAYAGEHIVIGIGNFDANDHVFRVGKNLLHEISKRMGVEIKLIPLPSERATYMLQHGKIHAELSRIDSYKNKVETAIKVEEPIASFPFHAYTLSQDIRIDGWDSLKPYKIVYVRGYVFPKIYLKNHNTHVVNSVKAAFAFIKSKRADLYIEEILTATSVLNSPDFDSTGIKRLEPPVTFLNTYTFFSSKYSDYAKSYHNALVEIKEKGIYQKILSETQ